MDSAAEGEPVLGATAADDLNDSPSQHIGTAATGDDDGDEKEEEEEEDGGEEEKDATADDEAEEDEETAMLDAAADFIGLVRDNDVETLRLGVDKFGAERAKVVCSTVETRLGGLTAFTLAAELGHENIIALFIQLGADVNSKNATGGWTPLHCAVSQCYTNVGYIRSTSTSSRLISSNQGRI